MRWMRDFLGIDEDPLHVRGLCSFGGSSGSTNTIQNTTPWVGEQSNLLAANTIAAQDFSQDIPQYYPSDTYAPLTGEQQGLMSNLINDTDAGGTPALQSADQNITNVLSPGYTGQTQGTFNNANNYLTNATGGDFGTTPGVGAFDAGLGTISNIANGTYSNSGTSPAFGAGENVLSNELQSSYLNPANSPAYSTAMANAMATALPAANASFVNGNRSDSGLAQAASTSAAANAAGGLAQQQFDVNQNIQNNAANQASQNYYTGENAATTAANAGTSAFLGAGGLENSAATQASSNLLNQQGNQLKGDLTAPMIDQATTGDLTTALNTAGMAQTDAQNQINANVAAYNYGQMLPWNDLGLLEGITTSSGVPASSTTTSPYFSNPTANVLSGVSAAGTAAAAASAAAQMAGYSGLFLGGSALL